MAPSRQSHDSILQASRVSATLVAACSLWLASCTSASVATTPAASAAAAPAQPSAQQPPVNTGDLAIAPDSVANSLLLDVQLANPHIEVGLRYATNDNFTGAPLPGYSGNRAFLRQEAAMALGRVEARAEREGLRLHVFDAYRPVRATDAMVAWTQRSGRTDLLRDGYIASRSRHNLGLAVDLTLVDASTGTALDMGTPFDTFSAEAHTANASGQARTNRLRLDRLMRSEGFTNYDQEWWHFTYPLPDPVRFDRVID